METPIASVLAKYVADVPLSSVFYPIHLEEKMLSELIEVILAKECQEPRDSLKFILNHHRAGVLCIIEKDFVLDFVW